MGTEESKKIVLGFFENLNAGNASAALDALSDSATWWIQGNFPLSGTRNKAQFIELLGQLGAAIDGALALRVKGVTAEGDRVAGRLAVLEEHHQRDRLHAVAHCEPLLLVDVDLHELQLVAARFKVEPDYALAAERVEEIVQSVDGLDQIGELLAEKP